MYFKKSGNSCRDRISHSHYLSFFHFLWMLSPAFWAFFFLLLPAGCSSTITTDLALPPAIDRDAGHFPGPSTGNTFLDILTFDDDRLSRLDSYQRISDFNGDIAYVESTNGAKIIFVCHGGCADRLDWAGINSYSALGQMRCRIENESRETPTRTGECRKSENDTEGQIRLRPVTSQVCINTISCDFSGTPYAGRQITHVKAYLINVCGTSGLMDNGRNTTEYLINHGRLHEDDLMRFTDPGLVFSEIADMMGTGVLRPDIHFRCLPNRGSEGSPSNPPTRLVIEGKIDGITYYWPINIGTGDESGEIYTIDRGSMYSYDILIRRKGTSDPDTPICILNNEIQLDIEPWTEKKDYGIQF